MTEEYYNYEMEELHNMINRCIEMLEESVGTCNDDQLLILLEEAHTALEQLNFAMEKYAQND